MLFLATLIFHVSSYFFMIIDLKIFISSVTSKSFIPPGELEIRTGIPITTTDIRNKKNENYKSDLNSYTHFYAFQWLNYYAVFHQKILFYLCFFCLKSWCWISFTIFVFKELIYYLAIRFTIVRRKKIRKI